MKLQPQDLGTAFGFLYQILTVPGHFSVFQSCWLPEHWPFRGYIYVLQLGMCTIQQLCGCRMLQGQTPKISKDAVFSSLLLLDGSRIAKQCEAACMMFFSACWIMLTDHPRQGFFNLSGLLHGGRRVAMYWGNSRVATFLSWSISHRQQQIIFLRLWEASASRHSFSFIPWALATCPPCRTDPWCLVVWFRLHALGCPAPDESLCEARGFWSKITIGDSSSDSRWHRFHRPCAALSES